MVLHGQTPWDPLPPNAIMSQPIALWVVLSKALRTCPVVKPEYSPIARVFEVPSVTSLVAMVLS